MATRVRSIAGKAPNYFETECLLPQNCILVKLKRKNPRLFARRKARPLENKYYYVNTSKNELLNSFSFDSSGFVIMVAVFNLTSPVINYQLDWLKCSSHTAKPGCPKPGNGSCVEECGSDYHCRNGKICCPDKCGHSCVDPGNIINIFSLAVLY